MSNTLTLFDAPPSPPLADGPFAAAGDRYRELLRSGAYAEARALRADTLAPLSKRSGSAAADFDVYREDHGRREPSGLSSRAYVDASVFMPAASRAGFEPADVPRS